MGIWGRFAGWRNRTTIRRQLSLVIGLAVVLMVVPLQLFYYNAQVAANLRSEMASLNRVLELESAQMDSYVSQLESFSLQLRNDSGFMALIAQREALSYEQQQAAESAFRTLFYSRSDVLWLELYLLRPKLTLRMDVHNRKVRRLSYVSPEEMEDYGRFTAPPAYISRVPGQTGLFQITRTIIDAPYSTPLAVVRFEVDNSWLERLTGRHAQSGERLYLFDGDLAFTDGGQAEAVRAALAEGAAEVSLEGSRGLLAPYTSAATGITLAAVKDYATVNASLNRTRNVTLLFSLGALLAGMGLILFSINRLTRPLSELSGRLQAIGGGNFKARADLQGSLDVTGLSQEVNRTIESLSRLIDQTYVASLNERTAQLAALEAQTNPHFLFNTLQAISTEAILAGDDKVYRMITALASLLRYSIRGGNLTELSTELSYVEKYLSLQKARFGERLQYEIDADAALMSASVPKLGLLALAENSIVHGMKGSVDAVSLTLSCKLEGDVADIRVTDDGAGISPERLQELRRMMSDERVVVMQNIGIGNLASRLRLLYGDEARLEIDSVAGPPRQTTVRILIPTEVKGDVRHADH